MRSAVLSLVIAVGCGGSVESTPSDAGADSPLSCEAPAGRYSWTWERKTGDCVMTDKVTTAPAFDCAAEPLLTTTASGSCVAYGDVYCESTGTNVFIECAPAQDGLVCDARVSGPACDGAFTLVMRRL